MKKMYFKHVALALGIVAVTGTSFAEEGTWRSVTGKYLQNPSMITPDWNGGFAELNYGIGETWSSNFGISQILDLPAGHYKMTVNAFFRYGAGDFAIANTAKNLHAFIFLGTSKTPVMSLYADGTEGVPNSMEEAANAFKAGKYVNTVEFDHLGGDLKLGIANPVFYWDEWCAFGNFKLEGPNGVVEIPNGDFSKGKVDCLNCGWDNTSIENKQKEPDCYAVGVAKAKDDFNQWGGCAIGTFRKAGGSPYNHGQLVELPAGKYRFGAQSFIRYGCGNQSGWWIPFKNGWDGNTNKGNKEEGESAYDIHVNGKENPEHQVYLYATNGWDLGGDLEDQPIKPVDKEGALYGYTEKETKPADGFFYNEKAIKCIFDEEPIGGKYPDNVPDVDGVPEGGKGYANSGFETQAVEYFINNPESYRNYVEFELTETTKVWVGLKKDMNAPAGYWNPYREFTLEKFEGGNSAVNELDAVDENAPVEYYNLQGVRVVNPEKGIYIVKQGSKVTKRVIK